MEIEDDFDCYFGGALIGSIIHYPLWRESIIRNILSENNIKRSELPSIPLKGTFPTLASMTLSRSSVLFFSDIGKREIMKGLNDDDVLAPSIVSTLFVSIIVQIISTPFLNASLALQDPILKVSSVFDVLNQIRVEQGFLGLFNGSSLACLRTVPKYTAIFPIYNFLQQNKDYFPSLEELENMNNKSETNNSSTSLLSSGKSSPFASLGIAIASCTAGVILTHPIDTVGVGIYTHGSLTASVRHFAQEGFFSIWRNLPGNLISVTLPISLTLFAYESLKQWKHSSNLVNDNNNSSKVEGRE